MAQNQPAMCFKLKVIKQNRLEVYLRYHNSININFMCFQNKYRRLYIDYKILIVFSLYDCTVSDLAGIIFTCVKKVLKIHTTKSWMYLSCYVISVYTHVTKILLTSF